MNAGEGPELRLCGHQRRQTLLRGGRSSQLKYNRVCVCVCLCVCVGGYHLHDEIDREGVQRREFLNPQPCIQPLFLMSEVPL